MLAVVALVALRLTIGWHFLYEGVWKIQHPEFSAEPFLREAKGPLGPMYHAFLPDFYGHKWLEGESVGKKDAAKAPAKDDAAKADEKPKRGHKVIEAWEDYLARAAEHYQYDDAQKKAAAAALETAKKELQAWLVEHQEDIDFHFARFAKLKDDEVDPKFRDVRYQKKRLWDRQQELIAEAGVWRAEVDAMQKDYETSLAGLLTDDQAGRGDLPGVWTQMDLMNLAVTFGITAIGLCVFVGFFTRLACLGGAAFLLNVVLSQLPWPTVYPPPAPVLGHALLVNYQFIEMVAMLALASTAVGRWAGVDYFIHQLLIQPFCSAKKEKS
ncbi:MAG: hypothetical protein ACYC35_09135 [Pirellulales bacterium]